MPLISRLFLILFTYTVARVALAQSLGAAAWAATVADDYAVKVDITYGVANGQQLRLDAYTPRKAAGPVPTLVYIHGGGWEGGEKVGVDLELLPYLEMGWAAVNVDYRVTSISHAPAAVEDCRCALRWVIRNAKQYKFDISKIVVTGHSAGGHLALMTGMLPESAGLDNQCPGDEDLRVAAIINWFGITDVADLLEGENRRAFAVAWLGSQPNRGELAKAVSPLSYVRKGLPPVFTIHGDADPTVPYDQAVRLHQALDKAGVLNQLVTIPGGRHGGFDRLALLKTFEAIRQFLAVNGLKPVRGASN